MVDRLITTTTTNNNNNNITNTNINPAGVVRRLTVDGGDATRHFVELLLADDSVGEGHPRDDVDACCLRCHHVGVAATHVVGVRRGVVGGRHGGRLTGVAERDDRRDGTRVRHRTLARARLTNMHSDRQHLAGLFGVCGRMPEVS